MQGSHIKDKEWGGWLNLLQHAVAACGNLQIHHSLSRESVLVRFSAAVFSCSTFLTLSCGLRQPTIVFNQAPVMGQGSNQMMWDTENRKLSFFHLLSSSCTAPWSCFACDSMKSCLHISKADHDCARPARANGCDRSHGQVPWPATADACPCLSKCVSFHAEYLTESRCGFQVVPMMLAGPNQYGNGQARS